MKKLLRNTNWKNSWMVINNLQEQILGVFNFFTALRHYVLPLFIIVILIGLGIRILPESGSNQDRLRRTFVWFRNCCASCFQEGRELLPVG